MKKFERKKLLNWQSGSPPLMKTGWLALLMTFCMTFSSVETVAQCAAGFVPFSGTDAAEQTIVNGGDVATFSFDVPTSTCPGDAVLDPSTVELSFEMFHSWGGDVTITLTPPNGGASVDITANNNGGTGDYGNAAGSAYAGTYFISDAFAGAGTIDNTAGGNDVPPGNYEPITAFSTIGAIDPTGTWTLTFEDGVNGDDGAMQNVTLDFCYMAPPPVQVSIMTASACGPDATGAYELIVDFVDDGTLTGPFNVGVAYDNTAGGTSLANATGVTSLTGVSFGSITDLAVPANVSITGVFDVGAGANATICTTEFEIGVIATDAPPALTCAVDAMFAACDQASVDADFAAWLMTAMSPDGMVTNDAVAAPLFCGGEATVNFTVTTVCGTMETCSAIYTVTPPDALVGCTVGDDETSVDVCAAAADVQAAIDALEAAMLADTPMGGCNPVAATTNKAAATLDCNAAGTTFNVTVTWTDDCGATLACSQNVVIQAVDAFAVDCTVVDDEMLDECSTDADIAVAIDALQAALEALVPTGGCTPYVAATSVADPDPTAGGCQMAGDSYTVTTTYEDACGVQTTCSASVVIQDTPDFAVDCTVVDDEMLDECATDADVALAIDNLQAALEALVPTGGCTPYVAATSVADPDPAAGGCQMAGDSYTVTTTYEDACGVQTTCSASVVIQDTPDLEVSCPMPASFADCDGDAAAIATAYNDWTAQFATTGGCNAVTTINGGAGFAPAPTTVGSVITVDYSATDDCGVTEMCSSSFIVESCQFNFGIADPCVCVNDQSVNGSDGMFFEIVAITAANGGELPAGMTWTIDDITGGFIASAPGVEEGTPGPQGPAIAPGATLQYCPPGAPCVVYNNPSNGIILEADPGTYYILFVHQETQGYTISVEGPDAAGTATNEFLNVSNTCFYPELAVASSTSACAGDAPFIITANLSAPGMGVFDGDVTFVGAMPPYTSVALPGLTDLGNGTAEFDPAAAGVGTHLVSYVYTDQMAPGTTDPGCWSAIEFSITVTEEQDASWTNPGPICAPDITAPVQLMAATAGGTWSGNGVDATGLFTATGEGAYDVTYCVGSGSCAQCETQVIQVNTCVNGALFPEKTVCVSSSNCYDLEQTFSDITTTGGVFVENAAGLPAGFMLMGTNLCYDPSTVTAPVSATVDYSVASYGGAAGCCVDIGTTTITIVPQPDVDMDLPSSFCNTGTYNLNDYVVAPSVGGGMFSVGDAASGITIAADGSVDFAGYTGNMTFCYTEGQVSADTECTDTDCEVVNIYSIDGTINDATVCSSSSSCVDLESLFASTTTNGGVFTAASGISGTNFCYDKADLPITMMITYTVTADGGCMATDMATLNIVEGVEAFLDLPADACSDEDVCDLANYVSVVDASGDNVANGIAGTFSVVAYNVGAGYVNMDGMVDASIVGGCLVVDDKFEGWLTIRYMDNNGDCMTIAQDNIQITRGGTASFAAPSAVCPGIMVDLTALVTGTDCGVFTASNGTIIPMAPAIAPGPGQPAGDTYMWDPTGATGDVTITYTVGTGDCAETFSMVVPVCPEVNAGPDAIFDFCEFNNKTHCLIDFAANPDITLPMEDKESKVTDIAITPITTYVYEDIDGDDLVDTTTVVIYDTVYSESTIVTTCINGAFMSDNPLIVVDEMGCYTIDPSFTGTATIKYIVGKNLDFNGDGAPDGGPLCEFPDASTCFDVAEFTINVADSKFDPTFDLPAEVCVTDEGTYDFAGMSNIGLTSISWSGTGGEDAAQLMTGPFSFDLTPNGDSLGCVSNFIPDDLIDVVTVPSETICGPGFLKDLNIIIEYRATTDAGTGLPCDNANGDHDGYTVTGPGGVNILTVPNNEFPAAATGLTLTSNDSPDDFFIIEMNLEYLQGIYGGEDLLNAAIFDNCNNALDFVFELTTNAAKVNIDLDVNFVWAVVQSDFSLEVCNPVAGGAPLATLDGFFYEAGADVSLFEYDVDSVACTAELVFDFEAIMALGDGCPLKLIVTNDAASCSTCPASYCDTLTIFPEPVAELACDYIVDACAGSPFDLTQLLAAGAGSDGVFTIGGTVVGAGTTVVTTETVVVPGFQTVDENGNYVYVDEQIYEEEVTTVEGLLEWVPAMECGPVTITYTQDQVCGQTTACEPATDEITIWVSTPNPDSLFTSTASPYVCNEDDIVITPLTCGGSSAANGGANGAYDAFNIYLRDSEDYNIWPNDNPAIMAAITADVTTYGPDDQGCSYEVVNSITVDVDALRDALEALGINLDGLWHLVANAENACGVSEQFSQDVYFIEQADATLVDATTCAQKGFNLTSMFSAGVTTTGGMFTIDDVPVAGNVSDLETGVYTVCYTVAEESDCEVNACATLTVNPDPSILTTINVDPFICAGNDATFVVIGNFPADVVISGFFGILPITPGNTVIAPDAVVINGELQSTATFTFSTPGNWDGLYDIQVTFGNATGDCSGSVSSQAYVIQNAIADLDPAGITVCEGTSVELEDLIMAGSTPGGAFDLDVTNLGPGTYPVNYTVGVEGQCEATGSSMVTVVAAPDATFAPAAFNVCDGGTVALNPTVPGGTWSVSDASGSVVGDMFSGSNGLYNVCYTMMASDPVCADDVMCLTINVIPGAGAGADNAATICEGDAIDLTTLLSVDANTGGQFTDASGAAVGNTVSAAGAYTYTVGADVDGNCSSSSTMTITVETAPDATFAPATLNTCDGVSVALNPVNGGGSWTTTGDGALDAAAGTFTGTNGLYTVCYSVAGTVCPADEMCVSINVTPGANAGASGGSATICEGGSVDLTTLLSGDANTGGQFTDAAGNAVGNTASSAGTYTYTVGSDVDGNCFATATVSVVVIPQPDASFSTDASPSICANQALNVTPTEGGGTFTLADGSAVAFVSGMAVSDIASYNGPGLYTICHSIDNGNGCADEVCMDIQVNDPAAAEFVPNFISVCEAQGTVDLTQYLQINSTTGENGAFVAVNNTGWFLDGGNTVDPTGQAGNILCVDYIVELTGNSATECTDQAQICIEVTALPTGEFSTADVVCLQAGGGTSSITLDASADPYGNDRGEFSVTDPSGNVTGPFADGDPVSIGEAGEWTVTYSVGAFSCAVTTEQTITVCPAIEIDVVSGGDSFCEGTSETVNLADYITPFTGDGVGTWTIDDVEVTDLVVSFDGLEAGTSLTYIYSVESTCDASCTANASVTFSIDEIKWNPCMEGLETDYCATEGLVDTVEFLAGSPFETVIFSGFGSDEIPVTDGSELLPMPFPVEPGDSPENYAGGTVEVCSPMNYYCGTNNELVTMNLSYNYLSDLTAVNGDWDSLAVVGPGGVVIVSETDPVSPADELFDDVIVSYDDILSAYAPFGGQDFLNALVSSCEPMCFEYYLITRSAPVYIELEVYAEVRIQKNEVTAYDGAGNPLPDGHFVFDETTGLTTVTMAIADDSACGLSSLADVPQPITVSNTTFDCTDCGETTCTTSFTVHKPINTSITSLEYCADDNNIIDLTSMLQYTEAGCAVTTPGGYFLVNYPDGSTALVMNDPNNVLVQGATLLDLSQLVIDGGSVTLDVQYVADATNEGAIENDTWSADNGCGETVGAATITVHTAPEIDFHANSPFVCNDGTVLVDQIVTNGTVTNVYMTNSVDYQLMDNGDGTWSLPLDASFEGLYTITVEVANGTCTGEATQDIFIVGEPNAQLDPAEALTVCEGTAIELDDMLTADNTPGGFWAVTDASGNAVDVTGIGAGTYNVTYTAGTAGCEDMGTGSFTVIPAPNANFTYNGSPYICEGDDIVANGNDGGWALISGNDDGTSDVVIATGTGTNFTYNSTGIIDAGFSGLFTLVHTVTGDNGCTAEESRDVLVINDPDAVTGFTASSLVACEGSNAVLLPAFLSSQSTTGGTYSVNGVEATSNFLFLGAPGSTYDIEYTVNVPGCGDGQGTAAMTVEVVAAPDATFTIGDTYCVSDGGIAFGTVDAPYTSTYTVNGVESTMFDPSMGAGTYEITQTISVGDLGFMCSDSHTVMVTVEGAVDAGVSSSHIYCQFTSEMVDLASLLGTADVGGVWTDADGNVLTSTALDLSTISATAGVNNVYTYTVGTMTGTACMASSNVTLSFVESTDPTFSAPASPLCLGAEDSYDLVLNGAGSQLVTVSGSGNGQVAVSTTIPNTAVASTTLNGGAPFNFTPGSTIESVDITIDFQPIDLLPGARLDYFVTGPGGVVIWSVPAPGPFDFGSYFTESVPMSAIETAYGSMEAFEAALECGDGLFEYTLNSNSSGFQINLDVEVTYNQVFGQFTVTNPAGAEMVTVANTGDTYPVSFDMAGMYTVCFETSECTSSGNCGGAVESCQTIEVIDGMCDYIIDAVPDICGGLSTFFLESLVNSNTPEGSFSINPEAIAAGAAIYGANDMLLSLGNIDFGGAASIDIIVSYDAANPGPCDCASDELFITVYNDDIDATFATNASPSICAGSTLEITPNNTIAGTVTMTFENGDPVDIADADGDGVWTFDIPAGYEGLFYVTHEVENGPCSDAVITPVYVISDASAELVAAMTMCEDAAGAINLLDLLADGTPAGGLFTVTNGGVTQLVDGPFTPAVGTTTISYSVGEGACAATGSTSITVNATPALDVPMMVCDAADLVVPAGASTSADADGNIVVTITSADGCSNSATVQVIGQAVVDLPAGAASVCEGDVLDLDQYITTSTAGGTWSGFQVEVSADGTGYAFDSEDLAGFIVTATYSVGMGDCAASGTLTIQVGNAAPDATFFVPSPLCSDDEPFALIPIFNGDGVAISNYNMNGMTITEFDPSIGAGTYAITHTVPNGTCNSSSYTVEVTVLEGAADAGFGVMNVDGSISTGSLFSYCDGDASGEIVLMPTTPGGNWSCSNGTFGTDADGNTVFQYDLAGNTGGSFAINYELPGSCGGTTTKVVQVFATPEPAEVEQPDATCAGDEADPIQIAGRDLDLVLVWSDAAGGDDNVIVEGAPGEDLTYAPGTLNETTTVWVGYTNVAGCTSDLIAVTWVVDDAGSLTGVDIVQCNDNNFTMNVAGSGSATAGGTYSWTQVAGTGSFLTVAPSLGLTVNPGSSTTYTVTYTTASGCESESVDVSAENIAPVSVSAEVTDVDYAANTYTVTVTVTGGSGSYSSNGSSVTNMFTLVGTIGSNVMVTVSDDDCGDSASVGVTSPDPFFVTDDEYTIMQGETVNLMITVNDGSDGATIAIDSPPSNGVAEVVGGEIVYTPNPDACGAAVDMFTYTATLGGETLTATVIINIECVPGLEILFEQTCQDDTGNFEVTAVIANPIGTDYTFIAVSNCDEVTTDPTTWTPITFDTDGFASPVTFSAPSDEGASSSYCIQIAELATGEIYTFADDSVSCVKTALELVEFDGRVETEGNLLYWTTASELDNDYFTIERSIDGYVFEAIQNTDSRGNSNIAQYYDEMDYTAPAGISYYRLLATDLDGKTQVVSQVISLERTEVGQFEVHVAPVPATDVINVSFTSTNVTESTLRVVDIAGKLISEQSLETVNGLNKLQIDIRSYAAGSYFLTVEKDGNLATTRFIKE